MANYLANYTFKKTFVCYKSTLSESELAWKETNLNDPKETTNLEELLDGVPEPTVVNKIGTGSFTSTSINNDVPDILMVDCWNCSSKNRILCNMMTHNHNSNNNALSQADNKIKLGSADMQKGDFVAALIKYSEAIGQHPKKPFFLLKRCDCLMAMAKYGLAINDALTAIETDPKFRNAYYRLMDCYLLLGEIQNAEDIVKRFRKIAPQIDSIEKNQVASIEKLKLLQENIIDFTAANNQEQCLKNVDKALKIASACSGLLLLKMRCLVTLKRFPEAKRIETQLCAVVSQDLNFLDALKIYYDGHIDESLKMMNKISSALRKEIMSFSHLFAKVERLSKEAAKAETFLDVGNLEEAVETLKSCLKIDPSNIEAKKTFFIKIAKAEFERDYSAAIRFASCALKIDPSLSEVLLLRAKAHFELKLFINALDDCQKILDLNVSIELKDFVERFKTQISFASINGNNETSENQNFSKKKTFDSSYAYQDVKGAKVDNRKFFENYAKPTENTTDNASSQENLPKSSFSQSNRYAYTSTDLKSNNNFKEFIGKPKAPRKSYQELQNEIQADVKNKKACQDYSAGRFDIALKLYSGAIALCPKNAIYLTNRAACYLKMEEIEYAISDAVKAVDVDPGYWKGYLRAVNCFLLNGDVKHSKDYIDKFKNNIVGIDSIKYNEIPKIESLKASHAKIVEFYDEENYQECLKHLESALKIAKFCVNYRNMRAECLVLLENYEKADEIINKAIVANPHDANLIFLQGLKFYCRNDLNESLNRLNAALRTDPDLTKALQLRAKVIKILKFYNEGIKNFTSSVFHDARECFTSALNVDPSNNKIKFLTLYNRGSANFKLECFKDACNDFTEALRINEVHIKSLNKRAHCHFKMNEFEDVIIDCEELLKIEASQEIKKLMEDARFSVSITKRESRYDVLGVTLKSTVGEIKKQFRKLSLMFHTDKNPLATAIEKRKLERKFDKVKEAYNFVMAVHNV